MITEPKVLFENIYKIKTVHIIFPFSSHVLLLTNYISLFLTAL